MATPKVRINGQWVAIGGQQIDTDTLVSKAVGQANSYTDQQIETVSSDVNDLQIYVDGSFHDGIITAVEAKQIQSYLNNLATAKTKYDQDYTTMSGNSSLSAIDKNGLQGAYSLFVSSYNVLVNYIEQLISQQTITSDQVATVNSYFTSLDDSISILEASIQAGMSNIAQAKVNSALGLTNGSFEFTVAGSTYTVDVSGLEDQFNSVINDLTTLNSEINNADNDSILTSEEISQIQTNLSKLQNDQTIVTNSYTNIDGNIYISTTDKTNLDSAYSDYQSAYNVMISEVTSIINSNQNLTMNQKQTLNLDMQNYLDSLDLLTQIIIVVSRDNAISSVLSGSASSIIQSSESYTDDQLGNYVEETVYTDGIQALQNQIDNQVDTWYYPYDPTLDNPPANGWTTDSDRNEHVGDMFLNISTDQQNSGQAYRFILNGSTYEWQLITDNAIAAALKNSVNAQTLAEGKRRTFVDTPYPPYDVGDLWVVDPESDNPQVWNCITAEPSGGTYSKSDWKQVGDVTALNTAYDSARVSGIESGVVINRLSTAEANIVTAQNAADAAQSTADGVQSTVGDLTITMSDGTVLVNGQKIQKNTISNDQLDLGSITEDKMNWSSHLIF